MSRQRSADPHPYERRGILHWGQKELVKSYPSAWYDHTVYTVPVTLIHEGEATYEDRVAIRQRLNGDLRPWDHNAAKGKFGGWTSCGDVHVDEERPGHVLVELLYHIGD